MKIQKIICDRCGREAPEPKYEEHDVCLGDAKLVLERATEGAGLLHYKPKFAVSPMDLCENCLVDLGEWFNEGRQEAEDE